MNSFDKNKCEIIKDLEELISKSDDYSYKYLKEKILKLTKENIKEEKGQIIHFIIDSYDGEKKIANNILFFLEKYAK